MKQNIKEKVLKEVREHKGINDWAKNNAWSEEIDSDLIEKIDTLITLMLEKAIDLTLAEVGKVIDDVDNELEQYPNDMGWTNKIKREFKKKLKEALGI